MHNGWADGVDAERGRRETEWTNNNVQQEREQSSDTASIVSSCPAAPDVARVSARRVGEATSRFSLSTCMCTHAL